MGDGECERVGIRQEGKKNERVDRKVREGGSELRGEKNERESEE